MTIGPRRVPASTFSLLIMIRVLRLGKAQEPGYRRGFPSSDTFEARLIGCRLMATCGCRWVIRKTVGCKSLRRMDAEDKRMRLYAAKPDGNSVTNDYGRTMLGSACRTDPMEKPARRLKEDSSTSLHGITNGGIVPIAAEIGQVFTASIHVKAEAGGRTNTLALAKMGTVPNSEPSIKYSIYQWFCSVGHQDDGKFPAGKAATITRWDQTVGIGFPLPQLPLVTAFVFMPVRHRVTSELCGNNTATTLVWGPQLERLLANGLLFQDRSIDH